MSQPRITSPQHPGVRTPCDAVHGGLYARFLPTPMTALPAQLAARSLPAGRTWRELADHVARLEGIAMDAVLSNTAARGHLSYEIRLRSGASYAEIASVLGSRATAVFAGVQRHARAGFTCLPGLRSGL